MIYILQYKGGVRKPAGHRCPRTKIWIFFTRLNTITPGWGRDLNTSGPLIKVASALWVSSGKRGRNRRAWGVYVCIMVLRRTVFTYPVVIRWYEPSAGLVQLRCRWSRCHRGLDRTITALPVFTIWRGLSVLRGRSSGVFD